MVRTRNSRRTRNFADDSGEPAIPAQSPPSPTVVPVPPSDENTSQRCRKRTRSSNDPSLTDNDLVSQDVESQPIVPHIPSINVSLNQQSLDVFVLQELNYEEIHKVKDYLTLASQNGRINIIPSDHIDSKLYNFMTLDFKAAQLPDFQLWKEWPKEQLIRHLLQLNPPTADDAFKPAFTLQHKLENLRLDFNPRDINRTGLKQYSSTLSRIRDEFQDDLQTSESTHLRILLDS